MCITKPYNALINGTVAFKKWFVSNSKWMSHHLKKIKQPAGVPHEKVYQEIFFIKVSVYSRWIFMFVLQRALLNTGMDQNKIRMDRNGTGMNRYGQEWEWTGIRLICMASLMSATLLMCLRGRPLFFSHSLDEFRTKESRVCSSVNQSHNCKFDWIWCAVHVRKLNIHSEL